MPESNPYVLDLSQVDAGDVAIVGGKCTSLGELFRELTTQGGRWTDIPRPVMPCHTLLDTDGLR